MTEKVRRILFVDDEEDFLDVFGEWLSSRGYDIAKARDGREALEKMRSGGFDLIILDLMMPRLDGYEFCKALKEDPSLQGTPILVLTAVPKANGMRRPETYGIDDYIEKLADHAEISMAIERIMSARGREAGGSLN